MTNEQLAVLLEGISEQLKSVYKKIDESLPDSAERKMAARWIGEGHPPPMGYFLAKKDDPDWEKKPTGPAFCLFPLQEEIEKIDKDIRCLLNKEDQPYDWLRGAFIGDLINER
ncbi:MAG: hypothetical protein WBN66_02390 [Smithella sp.]